LAIRTSSQTGNTNSAPFAFGSAVVAGDQLVVASPHTVTVDSSVALGTSPPQTPTTVPSIALGTGTTVTSLPSGVYQFRYTYVDSGGKESSPTVNIGSGSVVNGTSKPRVTFPALPSGVSSISLYLSAAGGVAGTETLYASGITTTTTDLISGSWTNGTLSQAASAALPNATAVKVNAGGTLAGSGGSTLTCRGDVVIGNTSGSGTLQGWAGGTLTFDPSAAASPTNAGYVLWFGDANNFSTNYANLTTSGTSSGSRFTIQTAAGGNKAARAAFGIGAFGIFTDAIAVNASHVNYTGMGDSTTDAIPSTPSTSSLTFSDWVIDTCGRFQVSAGLTGTVTFSGCTAKNSTNATNGVFFTNTAGVATGAKAVSNCIFLDPPNLPSNGWSYSGCYFHRGWTVSGNSQPWTQFDGNFVRNSAAASGALSLNGDITNSYVIYDTGWPVSASGTAASATSTTLTIAGTPWSAHAFQSVGSGAEFDCVVTGGTGAGQVRQITDNTSSVLTIAPAWTVTPDATSTFSVCHTIVNPHYTAPTGLSGNGGSLTSVTNASTLIDNTQIATHNTTVTTGANSATQLVGSTASWQAGDLIQFNGGNVTQAVTRRVVSVTDATHVVLDQPINTTTTTTLAKKGTGGAAWTTLTAAQYTGYTLTMETGAAAGLTGTITSIAIASGTINLAAPLGITPSAGDKYKITLNQQCNGNVYEGMTCSAEGDGWQVPAQPMVNFIQRTNVFLPNASGLDCSATPITTSPNQNSTAYITAEHNTFVMGSQAYGLNEIGTATFDMCPGVIVSFRSNLGWSPLTAGSYPTGPFGGSGGPYLLQDENGSHTTQDIVAAGLADYNAAYRVNAGYANTTQGYTATGYNLKCSTAPGVHDQTSAIASAGPQFVDSTRNLGKWAVARGYSASASPITQTSDALTALQADTTRIADLVTYVRAGFVVQNSALNNAGHDAATIGAMGYQAAGGLFPFFTDQSHSGGFWDGGY
jgi:hypothetical protein